MSTLILVRHGQSTSQGALSPLGEEQARKLGAFWTRNRLLFDHVYTGSLARQRRTAELVGEVYRKAGLSWPEAQVMEELNEYDTAGILEKLVPELARRDERFAGLVRAMEENRDGPEKNRHFQRMFEVVVALWSEGSITAPDVESWPAFRERVQRAIRRITGVSGGRRVAVFTSGGPIAVAVQITLAAPERSALDVHWRIRNCSLTGFLFSGDRFTLDSFNATPHLDDPGQVTFR